jgi:hypothetical protein
MLPCCASLNNEKASPFPWKDLDNRPSLRDTYSHIPLMEQFSIPFIADIHTHFFPEVVMKLIWKWFDKVNWEIAYRKNDLERVEILKKNKVKLYTTLNYAHKKDMADSLNLWVFQNYHKFDSSIPFGTFYPEPDVLDYVKKAIEEYGIVGFKLHLEVGKFDINENILNPVFKYLEKKKIPLVIHTGTAPIPGEFTGISYFSKYLENFPEIYTVVAHMGAHEIEEYALHLEKFPNLYLDTTMVFVDFFATGENTSAHLEILKKYPEKILFGSDFPNIPYNYSHPVEKLLQSGLEKDVLQKIFYKNFLSLPGLVGEKKRASLETELNLADS